MSEGEVSGNGGHSFGQAKVGFCCLVRHYVGAGEGQVGLAPLTHLRRLSLQLHPHFLSFCFGVAGLHSICVVWPGASSSRVWLLLVCAALVLLGLWPWGLSTLVALQDLERRVEMRESSRETQTMRPHCPHKTYCNCQSASYNQPREYERKEKPLCDMCRC